VTTLLIARACNQSFDWVRGLEEDVYQVIVDELVKQKVLEHITLAPQPEPDA
jgi:hypothetical protein